MRAGLIALLCLLANTALANEAADWLARVGPALRESNYQGKLVYLTGPRVESLQVFHAWKDGVERERWVALTGAPREMVRDGRRLQSIAAGSDAITYEFGRGGRWSPALAIADASASPHYQRSLGGAARVAGRAVRVVEVSPVDGWRYGYRLWLDTRTGLPLRVAVLDATAMMIEQIAFTEIAIGKPPREADLLPSQPAARPQAAAPLASPATTPFNAGVDAEATGQTGWQVTNLPPGFSLRRARRSDAGLQMLYSDGLASFSIYIEAIAPGASGESATRHGAVNARGFWRDGWRVVAVGKVPAATLERAARSIKAPLPSR